MAFGLSEEWVIEAEAQLGARLPAGYRAAMMRRNGGGDQLLFLREDDAFGAAVHRWLHETGELVLLAADFGEL